MVFGEDFQRRTIAGEPNNWMETTRYVFSYFPCLLLCSILDDSMMVLSIYFDDWSGHQGPLICVDRIKTAYKLALLCLCS